VATRVKKDTVGISDEVKRGFLNAKDTLSSRASVTSVTPISTISSLVETTDDCPPPTVTEPVVNSVALNAPMTAFGDGFFGLDTYTIEAQDEQNFTFFLREETNQIKFRIKPLDEDSKYTYKVTDPSGNVYGPFGTSKSNVLQFSPAPFNYWTIYVKAETDSNFSIGWKPPASVGVIIGTTPVGSEEVASTSRAASTSIDPCSCKDTSVTCLNKKLYTKPKDNEPPHYGRPYWTGAYSIEWENGSPIAPGGSKTFCIPLIRPMFYDSKENPSSLEITARSPYNQINGDGYYRITVYPPSGAPVGYSWDENVDGPTAVWESNFDTPRGWYKIPTVTYYGPASPNYGNINGMRPEGFGGQPVRRISGLPFGHYKVVIERTTHPKDKWPASSSSQYSNFTVYWWITPKHSGNIYLYGPEESEIKGVPVVANPNNFNEPANQSTYKRSTNVVLNSSRELILVNDAPIKKTLEKLESSKNPEHLEFISLIEESIEKDSFFRVKTSQVTWPKLDEIYGFPRWVESNVGLTKVERESLNLSVGNEFQSPVVTTEPVHVINKQLHSYASGQADYPTPPGKSGQAYGYGTPLPFGGLYIPPGDPPSTLKNSDGKTVVKSDWVRSVSKNKSVYVAPAGSRYVAVCPIKHPYVTGGIDKIDFCLKNNWEGTTYTYTGGASLTVIPPSKGIDAGMQVRDTGGVSNLERHVGYSTISVVDNESIQTVKNAVHGDYLLVINSFFSVGPIWRLNNTIFKDESKKILWTWDDVLADTTVSWDDPTIHSGNYWTVYWRCWFDEGVVASGDVAVTPLENV